jgi:hypothetical protein
MLRSAADQQHALCDGQGGPVGGILAVVRRQVGYAHLDRCRRSGFRHDAIIAGNGALRRGLDRDGPRVRRWVQLRGTDYVTIASQAGLWLARRAPAGWAALRQF